MQDHMAPTCSQLTERPDICRHEEAKAVAALQASAFYEPLPIPGLFNRFLQLGFEV